MSPSANALVRRTDAASDAALSLLSTSEIQFVYSQWCDVQAGRSTLTIQAAYIPIATARFISIETDWLLTTEPDGLHHHALVVRELSRPGEIFYEPHRLPGGANYRSDHTSLLLGAACPVARVDVLCAKETGETQTSEYDAGLLVTRRDGLRLAFVRQESISGFMQLAHDETGIAALTEGLTVRRSCALGHWSAAA